MAEAKYGTREELAAAPSTRPPTEVTVSWRGDRRFDGAIPGGPVIRLDGDAETGPNPVAGLLIALAACTAVDVADILVKRRTPPASLDIDVTGTRVDTTPRRLKHVRLHFRIAGAGIGREHAERAIELSVRKYCSVVDSIDPNIPVEWTLALDET